MGGWLKTADFQWNDPVACVFRGMKLMYLEG